MSESKRPSINPNWANKLIKPGVSNNYVSPSSPEVSASRIIPTPSEDFSHLLEEDNDSEIIEELDGGEDVQEKYFPWIQTYSGKQVNLLNPSPDSIVIQDIAHALSQLCRFTGHTRYHYSVAQHSVYVSYFCNQENALYGLLHDASEMLISDINSPLKNTEQLKGYKELEKKIQKTIYNKFGLFEEEPTDVKKADLIMLATEARDLMSPLHSDWKNQYNPIPFKIERMTPDEAEDMFMKRFYELTGFGEDAYDYYISHKYDRTKK